MTKLFFLLLTIYCTCYGQKKIDGDYLPQIIIDACNCGGRVIDTDSVYSFLKVAPLEQIESPKTLYFIVMEPIPHNEFASEYKISGKTTPFFIFTKNMLNKQDKENSSDKMPKTMYNNWSYYNYDVLPAESYTELFAAAWDSTVTYSQKIESWDIFKFRDNWFTEKQFEILREGARKVNAPFPYTYGFMRFSIPVFDSSYNYALIVFEYDTKYYHYIFQRKEGGWKIISN